MTENTENILSEGKQGAGRVRQPRGRVRGRVLGKRAGQLALVVKNPPANAGDVKRCGFIPWVGKIPWRRKWQPAPVFLPGKSFGRRSLGGYSPWGRAHKKRDGVEGKQCRLESRQSGCVRRRGQVEGAEPGSGWGQELRGGSNQGGVAWVRGWGQQWKFQKGAWGCRDEEDSEATPGESPPHLRLSSYPSPRDSAHSHPLPHGQPLPRVHRLRHQQHWPHPPAEDHSGLRFWHLLHPLR